MHLGGVHELQVDVRIIAATNVDLRQQVKDGKFREDLFYRLNVISIDLPPLRQRKEDIPLLVDFFLTKYSQENERSRRRMTTEALRPLLAYSWPGNVRELENVMERAVVLSSGPDIGIGLAARSDRRTRHRLPHSRASRGRIAVRHHGRMRAAHHHRHARQVRLESDRSRRALPRAAFHPESENQTVEY